MFELTNKLIINIYSKNDLYRVYDEKYIIHIILMCTSEIS